MKYLPAQILLLLFNLSVVRVVRAAQLSRNGETSIYGYDGTFYTAHSYRPICGSLSAEQFEEELAVRETCTTAMHQFRDSPDTFALYSQTGVRQSDTADIARGTDYCMCYALGTVTGNKQANFCILVDKDGQTTDLNTNTLSVAYGRGFAVGNFASGDKALPQCFEIDVAAVTASIDAAGTATRVQVVGPTTTTQAESSQPTGDSNSSNNNSSSDGSKPQTSQTSSSTSSTSSTPATGPAGIFVWLPIMLALITAVAGIIYKHKRYNLAKKNTKANDV